MARLFFQQRGGKIRRLDICRTFDFSSPKTQAAAKQTGVRWQKSGENTQHWRKCQTYGGFYRFLSTAHHPILSSRLSALPESSAAPGEQWMNKVPFPLSFYVYRMVHQQSGAELLGILYVPYTDMVQLKNVTYIRVE